MGTLANATTLAMRESFFGALKVELPDREHFDTYEQARHRILW